MNDQNKSKTSFPEIAGEDDVVTGNNHEENDLNKRSLADEDNEIESEIQVEAIGDIATGPAQEVSNKKPKEVYSALNRRINNGLQTTKVKVESFQSKYGGEPDFILIMRDNMTESNENGRTPRTNRKVVVTGAGPLCEEFKYQGLKFDPKSMIFMQKGKTLEKDFDMLEEWLEKRCESNSRPSVTANSQLLSSSPGHLQYPAMFPPGMLPPGMLPPGMLPPGMPYPFSYPQHQFGNLPLSQVHQPSSLLPNGRQEHSENLQVSPALQPSCSLLPDRIQETHSNDVEEPDNAPSEEISDKSLESSDNESDHGVAVGGKKRKKPLIPPARRKSNPLLSKDILAGKKPTKPKT